MTDDCKDGTCELDWKTRDVESLEIRAAVIIVGVNSFTVSTYYLCHGYTNPSDIERIIVEAYQANEIVYLEKILALYDIRGRSLLDLWDGSPVDVIYVVNPVRKLISPHRWMEIWEVKKDKLDEYHDLHNLSLTCRPCPTIWQ